MDQNSRRVTKGIDTEFYATQYKDSSASVAFRKGIPLATVTAAAGWSTKSTFAIYYKRELKEQTTYKSLYVVALISDSCYSYQLLLLVCDKAI